MDMRVNIFSCTAQVAFRRNNHLRVPMVLQDYLLSAQKIAFSDKRIIF